MIEAKRHFSVSTAPSGLMGTPRTWSDVWGFLKDDPNFAGFEMIGWDFLWQRCHLLLAQARKSGCNVIGIHGRIGKQESPRLIDQFRVGLINRIVVPTTKITRFANNADYLLVHGRELHPQKNRNAVLSLSNFPTTTLFIENDMIPGALGETVDLCCQLRNNNVKAGVMFDLHHFLGQLDEDVNYAEKWKTTLNALSWLINSRDFEGEEFPIGIHVDLGEVEEDSLKQNHKTKDLWEDLAFILVTHPDVRIVIEDELPLKDQLFLSLKARKALRERCQAKIAFLQEYQVLPKIT